MKLPRIVALLAALALGSGGVEPAWAAAQFKNGAEPHEAFSQQPFGARVIITADPDWQQKWSTPGPTVELSRASSLAVGKFGTILTLFKGAAVDRLGSRITCSIQITNPKGKVETAAAEQECFRASIGELGDARAIHLLTVAVKFQGEPSDPLGVWSVQVSIIDQVSGNKISAKTEFNLTE